MIKGITIKNFRNHQSFHLDITSKFVYISGKNGSGKTSILEAINYISTTKSHRTNTDIDVILRGKNFASINLTTSDNTNYAMIISEKGKVAKINNKEYSKLSDFIGNLKVILFSPEDLNIIKGPPSNRRGLVDLELIKIDRLYLKNLMEYKTILKQRNALLKKIELNDDLTLLNILGDKLYEKGITIVNRRKQFIKQLNLNTIDVYKRFSSNEIRIDYEEQQTIEEFETHFKNNQRQDILYKTTMCGPHRDDLGIYFNHETAKSASQGEQRLIIIALKLGLIKTIQSEIQAEVILLLDDVLSELDNTVQKKFLNELSDDIQIIMNSAIRIENNKIQNVYLKENENERA